MMGAFCSCLGLSRNDYYDEDEERRLLEDDNVVGGQYGVLNDTPIMATEDGVEARQEFEALQRVVAKASDNMVDIFEIGDSARPTPAPFAYAGQENRLMRYRNLLSKISGTDDDTDTAHLEPALPPVHVDASATTPVELSSTLYSTTEQLDKEAALVGTFADAAAAMK
ncbi:late endosomal/lysosomal adaptor and MAPK and MTOR activator domain-containing protein [Ceratocystis lukuohia]|uniref:Late endosomal/lysosomal adaptor and MAPK and MTOR activator 1 n=2 Tax=Ceratocystis TaxID=5157 RepID=A0A2C5WW28_9PEZI|nr:hypothetical protein CFIMG_006232RA [Ceratocystis fimbriata CBS 114723]